MWDGWDRDDMSRDIKWGRRVESRRRGRGRRVVVPELRRHGGGGGGLSFFPCQGRGLVRCSPSRGGVHEEKENVEGERRDDDDGDELHTLGGVERCAVHDG